MVSHRSHTLFVLVFTFLCVVALGDPATREEAKRYALAEQRLGGLGMTEAEADGFAARIDSMPDGRDYLVRHKAIYSYAKMNMEPVLARDYTDRISKTLVGRDALSDIEMKAAAVVSRAQLPEFLKHFVDEKYTAEQRASAIRILPLVEKEPSMAEALSFLVNPKTPKELQADVLQVVHYFDGFRTNTNDKELAKTSADIMNALDRINQRIAENPNSDLHFTPVALSEFLIDPSVPDYNKRVEKVLVDRFTKYNAFWNGFKGVVSLIQPMAALSTAVFGTATIVGAIQGHDMTNVAAMWGLTSIPWYVVDIKRIAANQNKYFVVNPTKKNVAGSMRDAFLQRCQSGMAVL